MIGSFVKSCLESGVFSQTISNSAQIDGLRLILDDLALWEKSGDLGRTFEILDSLGVSDYVRYAPYIIRGLDYYTDTVFEAWDQDGDGHGDPNPVHIGCQDDRVRWQLPVRDLLAAFHFLRKRELGVLEFLRTVVDPRHKDFGDLALSDPAMILAVPRDVLSKYRTHVRGDG